MKAEFYLIEFTTCGCSRVVPADQLAYVPAGAVVTPLRAVSAQYQRAAQAENAETSTAVQ
jgi:hypothetical protein